MTPERPYLDEGAVWRETCIYCHNTTPFLTTVLDDLYGEGSPKYQGSLHDTLLPAERRLRFEVRDADALVDALDDEVDRVGGPPLGDGRDAGGDPVRSALARAIRATWARSDEGYLVELGVGCEACHGGSREHVADPERTMPSYRPVSALFTVSAAGGRRARGGAGAGDGAEVSRAHWIRSSLRAVPQRPVLGLRVHVGGRRAPRTRPRRQPHQHAARRATSCSAAARARWRAPRATTRTRATTHARSRASARPQATRSARLATASSRPPARCARTRTTIRPARAARASRCHMPRKNMGLAYRLTRYHRIGSPNERDRVERDRPIECAVCHTDASVESLVTTMERWWGGRFSRNALVALYGEDLGVNVLERTLARGKPHEQAVAVGALGDAGPRARAELDQVAEQLANDIPLVRYFTREALERISGARLELDMSGDGPALVAQARAQLGLAPRAAPRRPPARASDYGPAGGVTTRRIRIGASNAKLSVRGLSPSITRTSPTPTGRESCSSTSNSSARLPIITPSVQHGCHVQSQSTTAPAPVASHSPGSSPCTMGLIDGGAIVACSASSPPLPSPGRSAMTNTLEPPQLAPPSCTPTTTTPLTRTSGTGFALAVSGESYE